MHSRQSHAVRLRAKFYAPAPLLLLAYLCFAPAANRAFAAPEKEKHVNRQVVKYVAHKEKVPYQGKQVMVLAVESLTGGRQMELVVKNKDMNKREYDPVLNTDNVNALTKGEAIKIELDDSRPKPMVTYLKKYDLKPGESDPKAYRFMSTYKKGEGAQSYTAVVLGKFDESTTVALPPRKAKEGQPDAGADMETLLAELKPEELVEAEVRESRPVPVLVSLERYAAPQTGKFLKLSEEDVADGQKGSAVEIDQDGKTVKALVPGKLVNKKWVSDAKVMGAARKLKAEAEVVYRTRQDGDKLWLKEIEPAPKAPQERVTSRDHGRSDRAGDKDMEKSSDPDGSDAGDRRGRKPRAAKQ
jgi:hypothetical protein